MGKLSKGRPHKGPRDQFIIRPTVAVGALVRDEAGKLGIPNADVITRIISDYYGLPAGNAPEVARAYAEELSKFQVQVMSESDYQNYRLTG